MLILGTAMSKGHFGGSVAAVPGVSVLLGAGKREEKHHVQDFMVLAQEKRGAGVSKS